MKEFFKPWRRRIGLLTLLMALLAMGGWVRTTRFDDRLGVGIGESDYIFTSTDGFIRWTRYTEMIDRWGGFAWRSTPVRPNMGELNEPMNGYKRVTWNWRYNSCGFDFGSGQVDGRSPMAVCAIPYWICIPLTGISAFALLSKPRQSTTKKTPEPIANEGA